jgi:hypothetical protein
MLFLLNSRVHDIRDVDAALAKLPPSPNKRSWANARIADVLDFVRSAYLVAGDTGIVDEKAISLAALIAIKCDANAALIVVPEGVTRFEDVQLRLANVSLPILANLLQLQNARTLSARQINSQVWRAVA